ncbi:MAG: hypothetical protein ABL876_01525 [Chitinophagaceae bacterium]
MVWQEKGWFGHQEDAETGGSFRKEIGIKNAWLLVVTAGVSEVELRQLKSKIKNELMQV